MPPAKSSRFGWARPLNTFVVRTDYPREWEVLPHLRDPNVSSQSPLHLLMEVNYVLSADVSAGRRDDTYKGLLLMLTSLPCVDVEQPAGGASGSHEDEVTVAWGCLPLMAAGRPRVGTSPSAMILPPSPVIIPLLCEPLQTHAVELFPGTPTGIEVPQRRNARGKPLSTALTVQPPSVPPLQLILTACVLPLLLAAFRGSHS